MRRIALAAVAAIALPVALARPAAADGAPAKPAPLVGATQKVRIAPTKGFVDDPIAADASLVAYVNTDGASFSELVVYDLAAGAEKLRAPLPADLGPAASVRLVAAPTRVLVVGRADDGKARAALIGLDGKVARRFGPAADLTIVVRDGKPRLAMHRTRPGARGATQHELELVELDKGKRVGKVRTVEVDATGLVAKAEFRVNHWLDGYTRAAGVKGGHWDPKENQRTPDAAAELDVLAGTYAVTPIDDVVAFKRRQQVMSQRPEALFARVTDDLAGLELWKAGAPAALELDQPLAQYDASTLATTVDDAGAVWVQVKVDPVNAAAVHRQKADVEYLDLYRVDGGKAVRKARVLVAPKKKFFFGVAGGRWWLLERSVGFDRGGTSLTIYDVAP